MKRKAIIISIKGTKLTRLAFYNQGETTETDFVCQNYRPLKEGFGLMQLPDNQFGVYQKIQRAINCYMHQTDSMRFMIATKTVVTHRPRV